MLFFYTNNAKICQCDEWVMGRLIWLNCLYISLSSCDLSIWLLSTHDMKSAKIQPCIDSIWGLWAKWFKMLNITIKGYYSFIQDKTRLWGSCGTGAGTYRKRESWRLLNSIQYWQWNGRGRNSGIYNLLSIASDVQLPVHVMCWNILWLGFFFPSENLETNKNLSRWKRVLLALWMEKSSYANETCQGTWLKEDQVAFLSSADPDIILTNSKELVPWQVFLDCWVSMVVNLGKT